MSEKRPASFYWLAILFGLFVRFLYGPDDHHRAVLLTLPLELQGQTTTVTTSVIYALGTLTTAVSVLVIAGSLATLGLLRWRQARRVAMTGG